MSTWTNKWTCPGYVFCPWKPKGKSNEYHTICCRLTGIMCRREIVEGKDFPRSKYIVLDSGFYVLSALIALKKHGVFAGALKKGRYWPVHCRMYAIDRHFDEMEVGLMDALKGQLHEKDYNIFCMKEPDYVCKIFGTAGASTLVDEREHWRVWTQDGQEKSTSFKCTEPFYLHFRYCHAVDDHNSLRHQLPSLEETWTTHCWACCV
ncbi:hypothetical protein ACHAW6_015780 [Cyclotella cf. meneghiniana]